MLRQNNSLFVKIKYFLVSESKQKKNYYYFFNFSLPNGECSYVLGCEAVESSSVASQCALGHLSYISASN